MTKLTSLPDNNVWLALAFGKHSCHPAASQWFESQADSSVSFCRMMQMGLLRLVTQPAALGSGALTQREAWKAYDNFVEDPRVIFLEESPGFEANFRLRSSRDEISPKRWGDDYLAAFAETAGLELVTFDKALAARVSSSHLITL